MEAGVSGSAAGPVSRQQGGARNSDRRSPLIPFLGSREVLERLCQELNTEGYLSSELVRRFAQRILPHFSLGEAGREGSEKELERLPWQDGLILLYGLFEAFEATGLISESRGRPKASIIAAHFLVNGKPPKADSIRARCTDSSNADKVAHARDLMIEIVRKAKARGSPGWALASHPTGRTEAH
jgi:hypothetical protein